MSSFSCLTVLTILLSTSLTVAQQIGPTAEIHPTFTIHKCTKSGGCVEQKTSIVLDALYRKINDSSTGQSCFNSTDGGLNTTICPTSETCAQKCEIDGISDYANHGVFMSGTNSITLRQWDDALIPVYPRVYLLDPTSKNYISLQLLNQEFSFTVDVSNLPCGQNGALFLSSMDITGGRHDHLNPAGAAYGCGYCDAGCPKSPWINGLANVNGSGACCAELDIWEANAVATEMALHPCKIQGLYECTGKNDCKDVCAANGCSYSPYSLGAKDFYGETVDTMKPFTVVTQFIAENGSLSEIRRLYVQNGKVIQNAKVEVGGGKFDSEYCAATEASAFQRVGGMDQMGKDLQRGMVPIFCIWNMGSPGFMNWLDAGDNGPCNATEGDPAVIIKKNPRTSVTFSDVRWGDIGSTDDHPDLHY